MPDLEDAESTYMESLIASPPASPLFSPSDAKHLGPAFFLPFPPNGHDTEDFSVTMAEVASELRTAEIQRAQEDAKAAEADKEKPELDHRTAKMVKQIEEVMESMNVEPTSAIGQRFRLEMTAADKKLYKKCADDTDRNNFRLK